MLQHLAWGSGSAIFGIGWGVAGYCPGPAIASLGLGNSEVLWLLPAMLVGNASHGLIDQADRKTDRTRDIIRQISYLEQTNQSFEISKTTITVVSAAFKHHYFDKAIEITKLKRETQKDHYDTCH